MAKSVPTKHSVVNPDLEKRWRDAVFANSRDHVHDEKGRPAEEEDAHDDPDRDGRLVLLVERRRVRGNVVIIALLTQTAGASFTNFNKFLMKNPANFLRAPLSKILALAYPLTIPDNS
jgi:hypothetical protein